MGNKQGVKLQTFLGLVEQLFNIVTTYIFEDGQSRKNVGVLRCSIVEVPLPQHGTLFLQLHMTRCSYI